MKYKKSSSYTSEAGGVLTILIMGVILSYMGILCLNTIQQKTFTISTYLQKTNLALDYTRTLNLTKENFDIGLSFLYVGNVTGVQDNIDEYFSYTFLNNLYEVITDPAVKAEIGSGYWWNQTRVPLTFCEEGRFLDLNTTTDQMGITNVFECPTDNFSFPLYGSYAAFKANVLSFQVDYCMQDFLDWKFPGQERKCRPKVESDAVIGEIEI